MQRKMQLCVLAGLVVLVLVWLSPMAQRASAEKNLEFHYPKDWKIVSIEVAYPSYYVFLKDEAGAFHGLRYRLGLEEADRHVRFLPR